MRRLIAFTWNENLDFGYHLRGGAVVMGVSMRNAQPPWEPRRDERSSAPQSKPRSGAGKTSFPINTDWTSFPW